MAFFNSAVNVLQTLVIALGAGLGIWGVINLLEGYGNDNPGAKYQGIQHFNPISYFGGNEGFEATKNRDLYKREKCKKYGVKLIEWRYDEPLTKDYIFGLLKNVDK